MSEANQASLPSLIKHAQANQTNVSAWSILLRQIRRSGTQRKFVKSLIRWRVCYQPGLPRLGIWPLVCKKDGLCNYTLLKSKVLHWRYGSQLQSPHFSHSRQRHQQLVQKHYFPGCLVSVSILSVVRASHLTVERKGLFILQVPSHGTIRLGALPTGFNTVYSSVLLQIHDS